MTSRKRQQNMEKDNKRTDYEVLSPTVSLNNESVDDLLANVDCFIEGVYRDLSISPPQRTSLGNTTFRTRRSFNEDSSVSSGNTSPAGAASIAIVENAVVSPTTRRNMDAEIERINRICDNVDQNLRSIGLFMNNSCDNSASEDVLNSNLTSTPSSSTSSMTALTLNSPPIATIVRNNNTHRSRPRRRRSSPTGAVAAHVIDLSESQTQTPEINRHTISVNNNIHDDDDDDVILVSANIHPVVDLCTPGGHPEQSNPRPVINQRQLNRRRLTHQEDDLADSCCQGPSTARKRRTEYFTPPEYKKPSSGSANVETSPASSAGTTASGHTPFMCPVCMESCLQRQPTSTRCGHVFCKECIEHAIRLTHKCPMCNTKISKSQIFRIYL
ncbi:E3 ubiquitin-protein ligase RNF4 [Lucilia cuprina]|nr:E3 ubiquitin-protein ligase RNF4 [Lucilia cuprina]